MMMTGTRSNKEERVAFAMVVGTGHGTFATWQLTPKREERGGLPLATEERSVLVLSLVYNEASELSRKEEL